MPNFQDMAASKTSGAKKSSKDKNSGKIYEIKNDKDLETRIKNAGDVLVVLDFYATWCMPCKMIAPRLDSMAEEMKDVIFLKIDVDDNEALAVKYDINIMPSFVFIRQGKVLETVMGSKLEKLEEALKKNRLATQVEKKEEKQPETKSSVSPQTAPNATGT